MRNIAINGKRAKLIVPRPLRDTSRYAMEKLACEPRAFAMARGDAASRPERNYSRFPMAATQPVGSFAKRQGPGTLLLTGAESV